MVNCKLNKTLVAGLMAVAALVLSVLPAAAQTTEGQFEGRVDVTEVLLDVLVTDSKGNVILGLEPSDFIVEEKGEPIDVTSATFYSNRRFVDSADLAQRLGVERAEVPVDRFFIIFFEQTRHFDNSLMSNHLDAVRRAKEWIHSELLPNDWVAVVGWDAQLYVYQDFTTDNEKISRALNMIAKGKRPGDLWESRIEEHEGPSLAKNLPRGKELDKRTRKMLTALETVGEAAGYITGRKNLLLFTVGLGEDRVGGDDEVTYRPDPRYYDPMMERLNDNNVAVYSISLYRAFDTEDPGWARLQNGMSLLADDTGGRYFFNFNNFREPLRQIAEDNNGYYLLSYRAEHPLGEEGYRKVTVKTVNPTFRVRARQGYKFGS
jgi:VWFA-related protein